MAKNDNLEQNYIPITDTFYWMKIREIIGQGMDSVIEMEKALDILKNVFTLISELKEYKEEIKPIREKLSAWQSKMLELMQEIKHK